MNLIMMGPQGSGKGSQGEMLSKEFNTPFVSTGELYRQEVSKGSDIGLIAEPIITKGELMPDEITRTLISEVIDKNRNGIIIDGYPRNLQQANDLDSMIDIDYLILLEIPKEVTIERISNRRSCKNGHIYNLISKPSKVNGICDYDGEKIFIRKDDKPEFIERRLEIYENETAPVIDYFKKQGKLLVFKATKNLNEVNRDIINRLNAIIE